MASTSVRSLLVDEVKPSAAGTPRYYCQDVPLAHDGSIELRVRVAAGGGGAAGQLKPGDGLQARLSTPRALLVGLAKANCAGDRDLKRSTDLMRRAWDGAHGHRTLNLQPGPGMQVVPLQRLGDRLRRPDDGQHSDWDPVDGGPPITAATALHVFVLWTDPSVECVEIARVLGTQ